jgi:hypothetical protein
MADWYDGVAIAVVMKNLVGQELWGRALEMARMPDDCFIDRSRKETLLLLHRREIECDAASALAELVVQLERKVK